MKESVKKEIGELIETLQLNCSIKEFKHKVSWQGIGLNRIQLSTDFIREFKEYVYWNNISIYQYLSEDEIIEFQDRVNWRSISHHKCYLSEEFLWKYRDKIDWYWTYASLLNRYFSEDFIYNMWIYLEKSLFRRNFLDRYKITRERLKKLYEEYKVKSRWEILDL